MNDTNINTDAANVELTPEQVAQLMADLHAQSASDGEATSPEGTVFIAEDDASHTTH
jgi:hypothetical protein